MNSSVDFSHSLSAYINGGVKGRADLLLSAIPGSLVWKRNAPHITNEHRSLCQNERLNVPSSLWSVKIAPYKGNNDHVKELASYLESDLTNDLVGAYVHGSLGSYEEILYSDFDALVILRDAVFTSEARLIKVAKKLDFARNFMLQHDPLQHHGWFVMTENQLNCYPESYFPKVLFQSAKSLFETQGCSLSGNASNHDEKLLDPLRVMGGRLACRLRDSHPLGNSFAVKSLLSQFMLLPAFYIQARDGIGIFKDRSFKLAQPDFPSDLWKAMDQVSLLRLQWYVEYSPWQRWFLTRRHPLVRRLARRWIAPPVPIQLLRQLSPQLRQQMAYLADKMTEIAR